MNLLDLNETRPYMIKELDGDISSDRLYLSPRLNELGRNAYPGLLRSACTDGTAESFALAIQSGGFLLLREMSHRKGVPYEKAVPVNAHQTLAEGEFNRFYLRGLCLRAMGGEGSLVVYRARESSNPRPESVALLGTTVDASALLADLRENIGLDTVLGIPAGPNSGLSVRLN